MGYSKKDTGLWRDTHSLFDDRDDLAGEMLVQAMPAGAVYVIDGTDYLCRRSSLLGSQYNLFEEDRIIAEAIRPSWFKDRFLITWDEISLEFAREPGPGFSILLWWEDEEIGSIHASSEKNREAEIDLPERLPAHIRIYIYWLWTVLRARYSYLGL